MKRTLLTLRSFFIITLLLLMAASYNVAHAQSTLLTENFGTGINFPTGWVSSTTDWDNNTGVTSIAYTGASGGSNAQFLNNNAASHTLTFNNNLSTVGYDNVTLLWGGRLTRTTGSNTISVILSWSTDGNAWNNVTFSNISTYNGNWYLVNGGTRISLPAGAAGIPNLRLRFTATASQAGINTSYRMDDLTVQGCPVSANISYSSSSFCKSLSAPQPVTKTGFAGGIYTSTAGLDLNASTGAITPGLSTAGNYTVTYSIAAAGSCTGYSTSTTVSIINTPGISQIPTTNIIANYPFNGDANDVSGNNNNGILQSGPSLVTGLLGIVNSAFSMDGLSQYISTTKSYTNPTDFTISLWFKTNTTTGGKLIGFGSTQTGSSGNYDRHIYMNNAGQVYFGVYPGAAVTINSLLSYNDNNWHLATATLSATAGMVLYMDGVQVAANPNKTAQSYTGYWRIGYDNINGWTSAPSSFFFNGILDDALIYHTALSSTQVATIYNSADGAGNNGPVCAGATLNLTATTVAGATYSWIGPNAFASALQNPTLTYTSANAGLYSVVVTAGGCSATAYTKVTAMLTYAGSPYCINAGIATPILLGNTGGTYTSTAGLTISPTTGVIILATSTSGTYTVTYTRPGCVSTANITIASIPTVTGIPTETCSGGSTGTITAIPNGGSAPYSYSKDAINYQASPTFTGLAAGIYPITIKSNGGCIASASLVTVTARNTMIPPTFINSYETTWNTSTNPKTTAAFDVKKGDVLVAYGMTQDVNTKMAAVSGGTLVWTTNETVNATGYSWLSVWTATADADKNMLVTFTRTGTTGNFGGNVLVFRNSGGVGASSAVNATGLPLLNLTTTSANSAIAVANADWNAGTGAAHSWLKNAGLLTEKSYSSMSTYSIFGGFHADAGPAGTYAVGLSTPGTQTYSIAAIEIKGTNLPVSTGLWLGANNNWNDAQNWCGGVVPGVATNVVIAATVSNLYPVITSPLSFNNILIGGGASITVKNTTLKISGSITNSGTFDVAAGTIEMNGTAAQDIPANAFTNNNIQNLIINNNVLLKGQLNITGTLSFGNNTKAFNTGDNLTLKSTATGTARIADITKGGTISGNSITGKVTIERYIPAKRAWRLLSAPLSNANLNAPTVKEAWQEGVSNTSTNKNPSLGYGVQITGIATDGFDQGVNNNSSCKIYDNASNLLNGLPNTTSPISKYSGYFLFVRGDRSTDLTKGMSAARTQTVLRMKGEVNTGDVSIPVNAKNFTLVGNPYPSAIDFHSLVKTNVSDLFYIWDPKLAGSYGVGGYVTLAWNGIAYDASPSNSQVSRSAGFIASGEAFFVQSANINTAGTLTVKESHKTTGVSDAVFRPVTGQEKVRVNLFGVYADGSNYLCDGVLTTYSDNNSNVVDRSDALKFFNIGENLSLGTDGKNLSIERRKTIEEKDTTLLNISTMSIQTYQLQVTVEAMENSGLVAVLKDTYSTTINNTPLNMGGLTTINFTVNADAKSFAVNRFSIVFAKPAAVLPVTFTSVKASQRQKDIAVEWDTENELNIKDYTVEISSTGANFTRAATLPAKTNNGGSAVYGWTDANVAGGIHYYRIKSTELSGVENYSSIVKVNMGKGAGGMAVYPNPVTNGVIGLQLSNMDGGQYKMRLLAPNGQVLLTKTFQHAGGSALQKIPISNSITKGMYTLEIMNPDNSGESMSVSVQ